MKTPELVFAEKFAAAALNWNLDKLYDDITEGACSGCGRGLKEKGMREFSYP
jgi:hypothetical protein